MEICHGKASLSNTLSTIRSMNLLRNIVSLSMSFEFFATLEGRCIILYNDETYEGFKITICVSASRVK